MVRVRSKSSRLDRFVSQHSQHSMSDVRLLVAQQRIQLDGVVAESVQQLVGEFTQVMLDDTCLQNKTPIYMMLNKPKGVVSATKDLKHKTVFDLIEHPRKEELHIVGRLDFNTTGLMLLTNDGSWSRRISLPESKLEKVYEIKVSRPLNNDYISKFKEGVFFEFENIVTKPAELLIVSDYIAKLKLVEGKYHQVKRMFGFFDNEVLELHRSAIGRLDLGDLKVGEVQTLNSSMLSKLY